MSQSIEAYLVISVDQCVSKVNEKRQDYVIGGCYIVFIVNFERVFACWYR